MSVLRVLRPRRASAFDVINTAILISLMIVMIFPFYSVIMMSFTTNISSTDLVGRLIPRSPNLDAYKFVYDNTLLFSGLKNTLIVVAIGVPLNLFLTLTLAYTLSKRYLLGRGFLMNLIVFTMFFSGGLVPTYLLMTNTLMLRDTLWAIILPYGVNTFNMIVMKNFFQSLPVELEESAYLDGAGDIRIFIQIALPLSAPLIATFTLFFTVDRWNEWFNAMLYTTKSNYKTMQLVLRELVVRTETLSAELDKQKQYMPMFSMSIKCAATVITVLPILCVYPFLQKYYTGGIMIGAIKS